MRVLVVGNGGREHALTWKIRQSPLVERVLCAPGNAGTALEAENIDVAPNDHDAVIDLCKREAVDLVVIGPEAPLVEGLGDALREAGQRVFGPGASGARLEGSKSFAKSIMQRYAVPTAAARTFDDYDACATYLESQRHFPVVLKADGLAAGKGVVLPESLEEALEDAKAMMVDGRFGEAGNKLLVEEFLRGEELSVLAITDGQTIALLEPAQDHKRMFDGDQGPNTGGMGAYSPTPVATEDVMNRCIGDVLVRVIHALAREKVDYRGVIYAGLMSTRAGPRVIEFNSRFGDPEIQPIVMRLKSDLVPLLVAAADGKLADVPDLEWDPRVAVCVIAASAGYPATSSKGDVISGLSEVAEMEDVEVFHAGTRQQGGDIVTNGGRVLGVTALGDTVASARELAYEAMGKITFDGMQFRTDIGAKAL